MQKEFNRTEASSKDKQKSRAVNGEMVVDPDEHDIAILSIEKEKHGEVGATQFSTPIEGASGEIEGAFWTIPKCCKYKKENQDYRHSSNSNGVRGTCSLQDWEILLN